MTHPREINEDLSDVIARSLLMEWIERAAALPCLSDLRHDDNEIRREGGLLNAEKWSA
ncbi:hypothetical protein JK208_15660 [Gluconobacter sp. Dm-74]|uniref:hypothetical protein n=1 Tax=Gluconobacter sp. Dm-74 TaxID=2799803 RepID=UPI001B8C5033|nr:hypothetical protein [Gluconobacter sp. Dm-74]MBS1093001.1 hypothetical protein [Gluconobacter sp. Dm-74]